MVSHDDYTTINLALTVIITQAHTYNKGYSQPFENTNKDCLIMSNNGNGNGNVEY